MALCKRTSRWSGRPVALRGKPRLRLPRKCRTITTSGNGGRVGPTSNDAGDQSQSERQIGDPRPNAGLLANADPGAALAALGPSRTPELASAAATATAPWAALGYSLRAAP